MDRLFWLGMLGFLSSGFILLYGIRRARAYAAAQQVIASRATGREAPQPTAASHAGDRSYIDALQTGDPEKIAKAHLPDLLTPEFLFQGLSDLRGHTSALDVFIERIRQQFALYQYRQLTRSWVQYIEHMGISQDAFWRQVTDRLLISLQHKRGASGLQADIAEQEFREVQARHAQETLGTQKAEPQRQKQRHEVEAEIRKQYEEEDKAYEDQGLGADSPQRRMLRNEFQDRIRRLFEQ